MKKKKLKKFFRKVASLTVHHSTLEGRAVVHPSELSDALRKVDPEWRSRVPARKSETPSTNKQLSGLRVRQARPEAVD